MNYQTLLTALENNILTITINRPDKLNALNRVVMQELNDVMDEAAANIEVKSIILTGAGPKSFVAGADISEFIGLSAAEGMELARKGQGVFFKIENSAKPVVAAVNGFALGGGCELALACHFRVAAENAKFGQPEVNLGLIPGYGGTQRLTQIIGKGRALEMLMSASMVDAQTALQFGLVNYVVPADQLIAKTRSILEVINTKAPLAVAHVIQAANTAYGISGYETEVSGFGECFATDDMKEGTSAFLEKRKARFTGK